MAYALIMAGGAGTRLWPLSRETHPKQGLTLVGERSMFQHAVDRLHPLFAPEQIFVVASAAHIDVLSQQAPRIPAENFIIEPEGRGTAPAIGLAALHLQQQDEGAVMAVLTADHFIQNTAAFRQSLQAAIKVAEQGYLVTLGIKPTHAETGFGYIQQAHKIGQVEGYSAYRVERFVEKPILADAERMLASGEYSWNSGMFIWQINQVMDEFKRQMPDFYNQLQVIAPTIGRSAYQQTVQSVWAMVRKETIDYGIMEGAQKVAVIPVDIGWADIGSWGSLYELLPKDAQGNIMVGEGMQLDTSRTLTFGGKRLIVTIGVEDLIVVDTEDALLVCKRGHEQDVKKVVSQLKEDNKLDLI